MKTEAVGAEVSSEDVLRRLERYPVMKARIVRLLDVVENSQGDLKRADAAEQRAIDELRAMGQEILQGWGQRLADDEAHQRAKEGNVVHQVKKLHWHSTFGEIEVTEQIYRDKSDGKLYRPFAAVADIRCRGYSRPLQRVIADFGADLAFGRVGEKLKEHYGITVPLGAAASLTYRHAKALIEDDVVPVVSSKVAPLRLIAEADGSMIPVVQIAPPSETAPPDKRKRRTLSWKEARLSLVRRPEEVEPSFSVTLGDPLTTGTALKRLARAAGLNRHTHVHGVGDGAPWIAEQMEVQFGAQGSYLIDFYHLCDYLAAAAPVCARDQPAVWLTLQKDRLKAGQLDEVMAALEAHREPDADDGERPVHECYRYIANRPGQFDYPGAMAANLPIGSGEVESAHRFVIQQRLKLPGAWWLPDNAQAMLNLRSLRANHRWNDYWERIAA